MQPTLTVLMCAYLGFTVHTMYTGADRAYCQILCFELYALEFTSLYTVIHGCILPISDQRFRALLMTLPK
jgi:hypothetical protein